jgi:uncharacterized protein (TIRG00374 family)
VPAAVAAAGSTVSVVVAFWEPSQHAIVLAGVTAAAILLASVAVTHRDDWVPAVKRHRRLVLRAALGALIAVGVVLAIAHRQGLEDTLTRVEQGNPVWLAVAVALETLSFAGYMLLTHQVYAPRAPRLNWPASVELTLAGVVATRLFSAGGAGGIAFTAWALNKAGMTPRDSARRLAAFLALLYSVYIAALVLGGLVVVLGLLGEVPPALGWAALAVGLVVTVLMGLILRIPGDIERRAEGIAASGGRWSGLAARLATVPQVAGNAARLAIRIAREQPWVMIGPFLWWAADIATLWASFEAFGAAPPAGTIVLCYFLGSLGNLLPLPGGVGGTEGGMVGAFAASGVDAGFALLAVIAYQLISTYLPAVPGIGAYVSLRRRMRDWTAPDDEAEPALTESAG